MTAWSTQLWKVGDWYVGSSSSREDAPVVVVPVAKLKRGGCSAVVYEFSTRRANVRSTNLLNLVGLQRTDSAWIDLRYGKRGGAVAISRIIEKLRTCKHDGVRNGMCPVCGHHGDDCKGVK